MSVLHEKYHAAIRDRDPRYDGRFFFGVRTTGIYCRPVCPAKPKRKNVEFFRTPAEAETAGYRPCKRCRPATSPHSAAWRGKSALVQRALRLLLGAGIGEETEEAFAARFGVTARHLRRLFVEETGHTPQEIHRERRLLRARELIEHENLPITEAAFTAGFASLRRFNDAFKNRFGVRPREIRKKTKGPSMTIYLHEIASPIGTLRIYANETALIGLYMEQEKASPRHEELRHAIRKKTPVLAQAEKELARYFAGKLDRFSVPLELIGTDFQKSVWSELLKIRPGQVRTYGDHAEKCVGRRAVRAASAAIGSNPLSIIVPCHRVVGATGKLTGYAGGIDAKRRLLEHEGHRIEKDEIRRR